MKWSILNRELLRRKDIEDQIRRTKSEFQKEIENLVSKKELDEFKKFAFQGAMVQMAIAFILGAAFKKLVGSISENIIMPAINYILLHTGEDWRDYTLSPLTGITFEIGKTLGAFVDFMIIAVILYIVYRKMILPLVEEQKAEPIKCIDVRECPECYSIINYKCLRCPFCTMEIDNG